MQNLPDHRMPPWRWWLLALAMALALGVFCLVTHTWAPLRAGWPLIALVVALAAIRQGADYYERHQTHHTGRRHAPHA